MTRSDEPLFDPRLADWLEDAPHRAPDDALEVVLAAFPSIKQRRAWRVPWRAPQMTTPIRLGLAAAAIVVAVGGAYLLAPRSAPGVGGPTPSTSAEGSSGPTPTPTAALIGTVTLNDTACRLDGTPGGLAGGLLALSVTNDASSFSGFDLFRVRDGYSFADLEAHVSAENERIARGEPYAGFPVAATSIDQLPLQPGESGTIPFVAEPGTYAVICVRGIPEGEGNPLAYYVVGPISVDG